MQKQTGLFEEEATVVSADLPRHDAGDSPCEQPPIRYNNVYLRLGASLVAAQVMIKKDNNGKTIEAALPIDYLPGMLACSVIAFSLFSLVHAIAVQLDKYMPWESQPLQRLYSQSVLGVLAPCMLIPLATSGLAISGVNLLENGYIRGDYPTMLLLLLVMFNLYYVAAYAFLRFRKSTDHRSSAQEERYAQRIAIAVQDGREIIVLDGAEIAAAFLVAGNIMVQTFDGRRYLTGHSLDELERILDMEVFFRLNRQLIANIRACLSYRDAGHGKLETSILPPCPVGTSVSQRKAPAFKEWLENQAFK